MDTFTSRQGKIPGLGICPMGKTVDQPDARRRRRHRRLPVSPDSWEALLSPCTRLSKGRHRADGRHRQDSLHERVCRFSEYRQYPFMAEKNLVPSLKSSGTCPPLENPKPDSVVLYS
ncbi:hypothetical protein LCGC14_1670530 [marine sediment metagenome]|uniref:Uncharacterized protein n=1 Tax=marine sediment metagenome TaxID=412755 RepID=A0A0F9K7A1_9ZZZZ